MLIYYLLEVWFILFSY